MKRLLSGMMDQIEGSFAPVMRGTDVPGAQPSDASGSDSNETTGSASDGLFRETTTSNGSSVFDDELE